VIPVRTDGLGRRFEMDGVRRDPDRTALTDGLGSTVATTTPVATPAIRTSFTYEPHGKPNSSAFPYLFTGRDYDSATGLQYNRARTYAPAWGRFTSEDPIGIVGGSANPYLYAANAPTVFTDPLGLQPGSESCGLAFCLPLGCRWSHLLPWTSLCLL
jgi:RHS repeat-associated protein